MEVTTDENRNLVFEKVFTPVIFKSAEGEELGIVMRDTGFEFKYQGKWYEAKEGQVREMGLKDLPVDAFEEVPNTPTKPSE